MALRLQIVSRHKQSLSGRDIKEFGQAGGTIGRSLDSDWTLPDSQRYLSSRHASIDFRSGSYYIVDTSTNGVYVNEAEQPVGRGKPQRLFSGDRVRIGEYEMIVDIDDDTHSHFIDEDHVDPVDIAQRVEAPEPTGNDMVDAYEITGVGIEMMLTEEEAESLTPPSKRAGYIELKLEDELRPESLAKTMPEIIRKDPQVRARSGGAAASAAAAPARSAASGQVKPAMAARPAAAQQPGAAIPPVTASNPAASVQTTAASKQAGTAQPAGAPKPGAAPQRGAPGAAAATARAAAQPTPAISPAPSIQTAAATKAVSTPSSGPRPAALRQPTTPAAAARPVARQASAAPTQAVASPTAPTSTAPASSGLAAASTAASAAASAPVTDVSAGKASKALEPFFRGAGIKSQRIDQQQADAMLLCLGQLMREMIVGLSENLHLRAEQKNALRLPNTTIQPQNNNPLKFSAGVGETVVNLLFRDNEEYLLPVEALREAFTDIKHHQQSLLRALRAALEGFVGRLDPDDLEQKFSRGKTGMLMNAANKLKYWDLYKDLYQVVAHHPPGELPMQFLDDFAHAYEQEMSRSANRPSGEKAIAEAL